MKMMPKQLLAVIGVYTAVVAALSVMTFNGCVESRYMLHCTAGDGHQPCNIFVQGLDRLRQCENLAVHIKYDGNPVECADEVLLK